MKSTLSMMSALLLALSVSVLTFAQGDQPDCTFCLHLRDAECAEVGCLSTEHCVSRTFTVECEADYAFTTFMYCANPSNCKYCRACAIITGTDGLFESCHSACHLESCYPSIACHSVHLKPGYTYTLYVCKIPCDQQPLTCDECPASCEARAEVKYPGSICPAW